MDHYFGREGSVTNDYQRLLRCNPTCRVERGSSPEFWPVCLSYLPRGGEEKKEKKIKRKWNRTVMTYVYFILRWRLKVTFTLWPLVRGKGRTFTRRYLQLIFSYYIWSLLLGQLGENIRRRYFVLFSFSLSFIMIGHNLAAAAAWEYPDLGGYIRC